MAARLRENLPISVAIDGVGKEKTAEEQHFGREKNPHSELRRVALLLDVVKLLGDETDRGFAHHFAFKSHLATPACASTPSS